MLAGHTMSAIDVIRAKVAKYPSLGVDESEGWIGVLPVGEGCFQVALRLKASGFTVFFEGWHEEIEREEEALELFARGLSSSTRLQVVSHGGVDHRWTAEFLNDGAWERGNITGLFFFPFWRRRVVRYLQNDVIPLERPTERAG